jgi:hypothetical protein
MSKSSEREERFIDNSFNIITQESYSYQEQIADKNDKTSFYSCFNQEIKNFEHSLINSCCF